MDNVAIHNGVVVTFHGLKLTLNCYNTYITQFGRSVRPGALSYMVTHHKKRATRLDSRWTVTTETPAANPAER